MKITENTIKLMIRESLIENIEYPSDQLLKENFILNKIISMAESSYESIKKIISHVHLVCHLVPITALRELSTVLCEKTLDPNSEEMEKYRKILNDANEQLEVYRKNHNLIERYYQTIDTLTKDIPDGLIPTKLNHFKKLLFGIPDYLDAISKLTAHVNDMSVDREHVAYSAQRQSADLNFACKVLRRISQEMAALKTWDEALSHKPGGPVARDTIMRAFKALLF